MTTPDPKLAARLDDLARKSIRQKITGQTGAVNYAFAVIEAYSTGQLITTAEANARVEAAVEACAVFLETHEVGLNVSKGYVVSPRNELSGGTHPGEAYAAAIRSRGVTV